MESGPATTPCAPISATQVRPKSSALARLITTTAAAPSEICDALPAVSVPCSENAGRNLASAAGDALPDLAGGYITAHDGQALLLIARPAGSPWPMMSVSHGSSASRSRVVTQSSG